MSVVSYIGPLIAAVLYVIVFQKAGFRGAVYVVCACPLIGVGLTQWGYARALSGSPDTMTYLAAFLVPLSLLPLIILAFLRWPPAPVRPSEK